MIKDKKIDVEFKDPDIALWERMVESFKHTIKTAEEELKVTRSMLTQAERELEIAVNIFEQNAAKEEL